MKIVSLNIRLGGGNRTLGIIDYLLSKESDLVVLSEFKHNKNGDNIIKSLTENCYYVQTSDKEDKLGVLVASKEELIRKESKDRWSEISLKNHMLTVLGVYVPTGSADQRYKDKVWQRILKYAEKNMDKPAIITGDFNSCTSENSENKTEYNPNDLKKLQNLGWIDSWENNCINKKDKYTWYSTANNGFRLDHAFISPKLASEDITVTHDSSVRKYKDNGKRLTDHSALIVEIKK